MIVILIKRKKKNTQKTGGFAINVKINVKINEERTKQMKLVGN